MVVLSDKKYNQLLAHLKELKTTIAAKEEAEKELLKTKQLLEKIAEGISDAVALISKDYKIIWVNKALLEQTNLKPAEVIGNYCYKVTHHRDQPCLGPLDICPIKEVVKTGRPLTVTHTHFDKEGRRLFVEVTAYPIKNEKGEVIQFVHLCRDVSERRQIEEKLKAHTAELEKANKFMVGRELDMIALKKEINSLLLELGRPPGYKIPE